MLGQTLVIGLYLICVWDFPPIFPPWNKEWWGCSLIFYGQIGTRLGKKSIFEYLKLYTWFENDIMITQSKMLLKIALGKEMTNPRSEPGENENVYISEVIIVPA